MLFDGTSCQIANSWIANSTWQGARIFRTHINGLYVQDSAADDAQSDWAKFSLKGTRAGDHYVSQIQSAHNPDGQNWYLMRNSAFLNYDVEFHTGWGAEQAWQTWFAFEPAEVEPLANPNGHGNYNSADGWYRIFNAGDGSVDSSSGLPNLSSLYAVRDTNQTKWLHLHFGGGIVSSDLNKTDHSFLFRITPAP